MYALSISFVHHEQNIGKAVQLLNQPRTTLLSWGRWPRKKSPPSPGHAANPGAVSIRKTVLLGMVIPMLKIRRPTGRLIFNMGIPIPGKTVFYIETGPRSHCAYRTNQTSLFSNPLMLLMCATNVKFAQEFIIYGKMISKTAFSAHNTLIWKLNRIIRISINKSAPKCIWCCSYVQMDTSGGSLYVSSISAYGPFFLTDCVKFAPMIHRKHCLHNIIYTPSPILILSTLDFCIRQWWKW